MRIRIFGRIIAVPLWAKYALLAFIAAAFVLAGVLIDMQRKSGALEIGSSVDRSTGRSDPAQTNPPDSSALPGTPAAPSAATPEPDLKTVTVYIVGAVVTPDVYELPEGSILNDLVKTAGGFTEKADKEAVNLAFTLNSGMMIRIPEIGDSDPAWLLDKGLTGTGTASALSPGLQGSPLININTASVNDLCTLPGIGESTSLKIINYRIENGPFSTTSDIMKVNGIKTARYNEIKNFITVG